MICLQKKLANKDKITVIAFLAWDLFYTKEAETLRHVIPVLTREEKPIGLQDLHTVVNTMRFCRESCHLFIDQMLVTQLQYSRLSEGPFRHDILRSCKTQRQR